MAQTPKHLQRQPATLSVSDMRNAFAKIDRRLAEVEGYDLKTVERLSDPGIEALAKRLDAMLADIFGTGSLEYARHREPLTNLYRGILSPSMTVGDLREGYAVGLQTAAIELRSLKRILSEALQDSEKDTASKALRAFEGLELHPAIASASDALYRDGHYSHAVLNAMLALNGLVQAKSGRPDLDGVQLMEQVFSPKSPVLRFNPMADDSDRNEQKGFMQMLAGAVAGLRNPRAHRLGQDRPERALEFIAFASLLAKMVDESSKAA